MARLLFLRAKMWPTFSGNDKYWERMYPLLMGSGTSVVAVVGLGSPGAAAEETVGAIRYFRLNRANRTGYRGFFGYWWDATRILFRLRGDFDIMFTYGQMEGVLLTILSAKLLGKKVVLESTLEGSDDPLTISRRTLGWLRMWLYRLADAHVSISPALTATYAVAMPGRRVFQIPRGSDTDVFHPVDLGAKLELRRQLGVPIDKQVAVFVGSIARRKGIDILIDAWVEVVARRGSEVLLLCIGPTDASQATVDRSEERGQFVAAITERVQRDGLGETVVFTGITDRVADYLRIADLFIFPSRREGMPNALIEAMASGLPCISSSLKGTADSMLGDSGVVIGTESPRDYADAITNLLADRDRAERLGRGARTIAIERYSLRARVGSYLEVFAYLSDRHV